MCEMSVEGTLGRDVQICGMLCIALASGDLLDLLAFKIICVLAVNLRDDHRLGSA